MATMIVAYCGAFIAASKIVRRGTHGISDEILVMRALGTCAFVLLHVILCIGPLARLDRRWLPLLYNRRHLGVTTCLIAVGHAALAIGFYHGFGVINPVRSLLTSNVEYRSVSGFPFEILGAGALVILIAMAATSHNYWLHKLSPSVWKTLHMAVYFAWGLLILHVALGALQAERNWVYPVLVGMGIVVVAGLHLVAGMREQTRERGQASDAEWVDVGDVHQMTEGRGTVVCLSGRERVAVFRYGKTLSAMTNVCAHQGGPLGEGRIVNGCVTCPWHGYQYRPGDGCAPPPFTEKLATYRVKVEAGRVMVNRNELVPGTVVEPAQIGGDERG
jgi:methionine sulfoxide reductase heme-binding subunit